MEKIEHVDNLSALINRVNDYLGTTLFSLREWSPAHAVVLSVVAGGFLVVRILVR